jgi:hypothetical protein
MFATYKGQKINADTTIRLDSDALLAIRTAADAEALSHGMASGGRGVDRWERAYRALADAADHLGAMIARRSTEHHHSLDERVHIEELLAALQEIKRVTERMAAVSLQERIHAIVDRALRDRILRAPQNGGSPA